MTRHECKEKIIDHMREIAKIIREYDTNINYVNCSIYDNDINVYDEYYNRVVKPIHAFVGVDEDNSEIFRSDEI